MGLGSVAVQEVVRDTPALSEKKAVFVAQQRQKELF